MKERTYRFAEFELNLAAGELRNGDKTTRLQDKPLLLLTALLEHAQHLVTREELRMRMWDSRTVVEYEQGINAAIKKVRDALGDTADHPKFVETVAKRGYRFLLPVTVVDETAAAAEAPAPLAPPVRPRWKWAVAAGILGIAGIWFVAAHFPAQRPTTIHSLAVLPLQNLSPDAGQEYFADGITEEVITRLAQTLPVRVISRTSVMGYKQTHKSVTQIAKELGVEAIVEGSVARSGDRVSVTVQLIDAVEDRHLWAEKYERRIEDIMLIEAELSQAIASKVTGTLTLRTAGPVVPRRVDPQVYEFCLLGRYHWNKRTTADLAKAQQYFEQAIARDPSYAPAHAGLADVFALQPFYGAARFEDNSQKAVASAQRALTLDASLADAHATLGLVRLSSREWPKSADAFRRSLELNPNYATAHHWYSYYLRFANRLAEACAEIEIARQLDPLSAIINTDQGEMLNAAGRYAEARRSLQRAMELSPNLARPHAFMTVTDLATGHTADAVQEARTALSLEPLGPSTLAYAGYAFAVAGNTDEALGALAKLKDLASRDINVSMYAAMVESGLGLKEDALATLERQARSPRSIVLQGIQTWYAFQSLRTEPRFRAVLSQAW